MKRILVICLLMLLPLFGQSTSGFSLLKMTVDGRVAAMAGAGVAGSGDVGFAAENPAALAGSKKLSAMVMLNDALLDYSQGAIAVQLMKGNHNLFLFTNYLKFPSIEIRGEVPTVTPAGFSDAYNLSFGVGYATTWKSWQIGARAKYLFEKYYLDSAPGWAMDFGLRRPDILPGLDMGLVVYNIGWMSTLKTQATTLPLFVKAGFHYTVPGDVFKKHLKVLPEIQWVTRQALIPRLGLEYEVSKLLSIYSGGQLDEGVFNWAAGFAIRYKSFQMHYAYAPFSYDLGNSNRLSLLLSF